MTPSIHRKLVAETVGTFFLLVIIVGSGIMGDRLSNGSIGLALLANSIATGAGLVVLILMFSRISGAHFNPLISVAEALRKQLSKKELAFYITAQLAGAIGGVIVAHIMFGEIYLGMSTHAREGWTPLLSEFIATFGLIAVILGVSATQPSMVPFAVGLYITAAYWFTASTSFANPVVTIARAFTPTFTGIRLQDVPGFFVAQILGATSAEYLFKWLYHNGSKKR